MRFAGSRGDKVGTLATFVFGHQADATRSNYGSSGSHRLQAVAGDSCETLEPVCHKLAEAGRASTGDSVSWVFRMRFPIELFGLGGRESGKLDISAIINEEFRKCSLTTCSGNSSPCAPAHA